MDFLDYSRHDRGLFSLSVVETGVTLAVIIYVQITKGDVWSIPSYYELAENSGKTYIYAIITTLIVNIVSNWGEFDFCIKYFHFKACARLAIAFVKLSAITCLVVFTYYYQGPEIVYLSWLIVNLSFSFWH